MTLKELYDHLAPIIERFNDEFNLTPVDTTEGAANSVLNFTMNALQQAVEGDPNRLVDLAIVVGMHELRFTNLGLRHE